jgi:branched-chain amino acid transport system substrate-binding protein
MVCVADNYRLFTFVSTKRLYLLLFLNDCMRGTDRAVHSEKDGSRRAFLKTSGAVATVGLASLAGCINSFGGSGNKIKLGAINPLSGPASELGQTVQKVQKGWEKNINNNGGIKVDGEQRKVNLIEYDDESKNSQARSAMEKLATVDKVSGVVSTFRSSGALAVAPLAKEYTIPVFTAGMTPKVNEPGSCVFRHLPSTAGEALPNLNLISNKWGDIQTIGVIAEEGDWGNDTLNLMEWWFHKAGNKGDFKALGRFSFSQQDFSSFITKLDNAYEQGNIDAVYVQTWASALEQFMIQQNKAGLNKKMPIITGTGLADFASVDNIGSGMDNAYTETQSRKMMIADDYSAIRETIDDEVYQNYKTYEELGLPKVPIALHAYTFCESMAAAIESTGSTDSADIRKTLVNTDEGFTTSIGKFTYADNGQPAAPITNIAYEYKNGSPAVKEVPWSGTLPPVVNIPPKVDTNF